MFHPEKDLREAIFEILRTDGKSISALSRDLEAQGFNIHRLVLTGYLRALTDLNILKEKEVPPAKVYVPVKGKERDVYEIVGERSRQITNEEEADSLILYTLGKLFKRPVFFEELKRAGVKENPPGRQVSAEERQEARKGLQKAGVKVPDSNPAYAIEDEGLESKFEELLVSIIIELFDIAYLIRETKQTKLSLDSAPKP